MPSTNIGALKRGRQRDPDYDKAYENIVNGMGQEEAFQVYAGEAGKHKRTRADRHNFSRAMRDRKKNDDSN